MLKEDSLGVKLWWGGEKKERGRGKDLAAVVFSSKTTNHRTTWGKKCGREFQQV